MTKEEFRRDFISYSGGFTPDEAHNEMMTYIESGANFELTRKEADAFFDEWLEELEQ